LTLEPLRTTDSVFYSVKFGSVGISHIRGDRHLIVAYNAHAHGILFETKS